MNAQSRLAQYVFLYAILRGLDEVVLRLLEDGILNTESPMPDANFVKELHRSTIWFGGEPSLDATVAGANVGLGPRALDLALSACQYRAASYLVEHGVAAFWGICLLATSKSAKQLLQNELNHSRQRNAVLPNYLCLLEQTLLEQSEPPGLTMSFDNGLLPP